jgi:O-antigen/teichoic acid export membrane protein
MKNTFIRDVLSVLKSNIAIIFFNLIKVAIIARVLGPELNGQIAVILVYPSLFIVMGGMGIRKSSAFLIAQSPNLKQKIYKSIVQFWVLTSTVCVSASILLLLYANTMKLDNIIIFLVVIPIVFSLLNNYMAGIYLGENRISEFNKINWLPTLFNLLSIVLFLILLDFKVEGVLVSIFISQFLVSLVLIYKLKIFKHFSLTIEKTLLLKMLSLGFSFAFALFLLNLNYRIDIIMMDYLSNDYETGLYSKASVLTQYLWQIPAVLGTVIFARGAASSDKLEYSKKCCRLFRMSFLIVLFSALILAGLGKFIVHILFGTQFSEAIFMIYAILPGVVLFILFKVLNNDISSRGKPLFIMPSMIFGILINLISNYFLIPLYGGVGAAISSSISYALAAIIFVIRYSRLTTIPLREMFTYKKNDFQIVFSSLKSLKLVR